ncbi:MAG TPA: EF-hand domain-containing protein [Methylophilaceae bacterium]|nr:EF-hand domain-containing protein [Methylophilaceae bacterium]
MRFRKTAAFAAMLGLFAFGSAYAGDGEGCHKHGDGMKKSDTNNDGKLSYDEFRTSHEQRMEKHFKRMDANSDGFVDAGEKQAARDKAREMFKKHHPQMQEQSDKSAS